VREINADSADEARILPLPASLAIIKTNKYLKVLASFEIIIFQKNLFIVKEKTQADADIHQRAKLGIPQIFHCHIKLCDVHDYNMGKQRKIQTIYSTGSKLVCMDLGSK
jgi:hypothetical protein